jgi:signal transduction histidine kinase
MNLQISADEASSGFQLTRIESWIGVSNFLVVDLDGDGADDLFRLYDGHRIYKACRFVREGILGPALYQGNSPYFICQAVPVNVDTTPGTEIALIKQDISGDSLWIEIFKGAEKVLLCKTRAIVGEDLSKVIDHWDGSASNCYAEDLDDDGSKEIILPLVVAYDLYPRGIYVYDYPSGELKWWFPLAGSPMPLIFADANKDGFKEIYVKTFGSFNGAVVGDLVDTLSYIHVIDHLGYLLWRQILGDAFDLTTREPHICDCDGDGTIEIYYTMIMDSEEFDQRVWALQKRRAKDNFFIDQLQFGVDQDYICIYSADFEGNDSLKLFLDKNMCLIDPVDLSIHQCGEIRNGHIVDIEDIFDEDPRPEILIALKDSIYIADADLNIRAAFGRDFDGYYTKLDYIETQFGDHYILATAIVPSEGSSTTMEVFNVEFVPDILSKEENIPLWLLFGGIAIGVLMGGIISYFIFKDRRPRRLRKAPQAAQLNNLLTTLVNFNHGNMAGKNLNRLLFLFSNLPESQEKMEEIKPNLKSAIEAYLSFTASQLHSIIGHSRKLSPIKSTTGKLAGQTKRLSHHLNELSPIEISLADRDDLKIAIPEAINIIKQAITEIREFVQKHFSTHLLHVIPQVLSAVAGEFQQQGIGFTEITTRGGAAAMVFFDEAELASIFEEFLSNACDAMAESNKKEMSLDVRFEGAEVVIKLSDTGHGLEKKDIDRVFSRDFSTRGDKRGYGLFHARQRVERFGGRIRMYNNANGPGATVEMSLKTVDYA